jgi:hypothetical protein
MNAYLDFRLNLTHQIADSEGVTHDICRSRKLHQV